MNPSYRDNHDMQSPTGICLLIITTFRFRWTRLKVFIFTF